MKLFIDCLPCMLRQVLEAARMATTDEVMQEQIMNEAVQVLSGHKFYNCAPKLGEAMHAVVKRHSGVTDPYAEIKSRDIAEALRLEPLIRRFAFSGDDFLLQALKVSATGNVMDSALYNDLDIEACLNAELEKGFRVCDWDAFQKDIKMAKKILIIGDNAGEAVFDKVLAQYLSVGHEVIYAVRDEAIINDITTDEAAKTGIADHVTIISTGCGAPGAVLESCSKEFRTVFDNADIVISKGQGNFEALSDTSRTVYFLLKAKCPRIAKALGVDVNEYVFRKKM